LFPKPQQGVLELGAAILLNNELLKNKFDTIKNRIKFGSSSGFNVGIFLGFSKAMPMPDAGFASIKPVFTE